jgi:NADH dehydrogenase [ubiquinone] 1 alpha subcomplex assembly factor 7
MLEDPDRPEPERAIRRAIAERGPISFAEFMELALYGPGGFYEQPPVGERGHFVTSPHVHVVFGILAGRAVRECLEEMGDAGTPSVVEVGAGDGTLIGVLRGAVGEEGRRFVAVDRSPGARDAIASRHPDVRVAASLETLDQHIEGVVVANELLDNLPFRWVRRDDDGDLEEALVGVGGDRLVPVWRPFPPEDHERLEAVPAHLQPGGDAVLPEGALHFVERLARMLRRGYAVLIDYAAGAEAGIHGYRGHRVVEDVLDRPGSADVTAGVDFGVLERRAEALGLRSFGTVSQREALIALGYERWAEHERRRQREAQDLRAGREAVEAWSGRNTAAALVDPAGLGRLRWWVVATYGMAPPQWLVAARAGDRTTMRDQSGPGDLMDPGDAAANGPVDA